MGLYYLQSRYYNPTLGRFLNADALVSTGQGVLGNNMFAYCLNNPIFYTDASGYLAYPGEIHNEVAWRIAREYGLHQEQKILYSFGGYGRADLISDDGEVWEIKRDRRWQIRRGEKQLQNYVQNTWANNPGKRLSIGGYIQGRSFYYCSLGITYLVTYSYVGNGIIAYDYHITDVNLDMLFLVTCMGAGAGLVHYIFTTVPTRKERTYICLY